MATFRHITDVTTTRIFDIQGVNRVVGVVVRATSMHLLRALLPARHLLAGLVRRLGPGQWAVAKCHAGPAGHLTRPRSADGLSRF